MYIFKKQNKQKTHKRTHARTPVSLSSFKVNICSILVVVVTLIYFWKQTHENLEHRIRLFFLQGYCSWLHKEVTLPMDVADQTSHDKTEV